MLVCACVDACVPAETISFPELCYNGGFHNGVKCICPNDLFYGPKCEFPVPEVTVPTVPVGVTVGARVRITNQNYTEELKDRQSEAYQLLEKDFKNKMDHVYKDIPGYREVVIVDLRNGSIIVDHDVVVETVSNNSMNIINVTIRNVIEAVRDQLIGLNSTETSCSETLCFSVPADPILNSTSGFSGEDLCRNMSEMQFPDFAAFYYPLVVGGVLRCVTDCSSYSPRALDCHHGACHVTGGGPQCNCNDLDIFWYLDHRCQSRVQKAELGLGLGMAAFAATCAILGVFLFRANRRKSPSPWSDDAEASNEEADEWTPPGGSVFSNSDADSWHRSRSSRKVSRPTVQAVDSSVLLSWQVQFPQPQGVSNC